MNGFRRFCCVIFGLAGILALVALVLPWIGPWQAEAASLIAVDWYFKTLAVLVCLTALGLVIQVFRGIFSKKVKNVVITDMDGGTITVTRDAIASQAAHIVAAGGTCTAERVRVRVKRNRVRVFVRVLPHETVDVVVTGAELHESLMSGLASVCGDTIADVSLEFVEPETVTAPVRSDDGFDVADGRGLEPAEPVSTEIRLPMGGASSVPTEEPPDAGEALESERAESY